MPAQQASAASYLMDRISESSYHEGNNMVPSLEYQNF
jgi:hypothetical protein